MSSEGLTYGVSQLRLMDQDAAAEHNGAAVASADRVPHARSDEVAEVGGGAVDDPPGGQVANRRQLKHQAWTDGDAAAYGACFTADCDYISFDGTRAHGHGLVAAAAAAGMGWTRKGVRTAQSTR